MYGRVCVCCLLPLYDICMCTPFVCHQNVLAVVVVVLVAFAFVGGSKSPFHCCLQIIDVDCLNEMFAVCIICF